MGSGYLVDVESLAKLGQDLDEAAGFLDGGDVGASGLDLTDWVSRQQPALGGAPERPALSTSDQTMPDEVPAPAVTSFSDNWEDVRARLAEEMRSLAEIIGWAADTYEERDLEEAFRFGAGPAPGAPAITAEPDYTG